MARENHSWGYDRIVGAPANLGYLAILISSSLVLPYAMG